MIRIGWSGRDVIPARARVLEAFSLFPPVLLCLMDGWWPAALNISTALQLSERTPPCVQTSFPVSLHSSWQMLKDSWEFLFFGTHLFQIVV